MKTVKGLSLAIFLSFTFMQLFSGYLLANAVSAASPALSYYVSPSGIDANPGSEEQPFQTIGRARDAIRAINSGMQGDITVYIEGGTYELSETLQFDERDSGNNGYKITYKNWHPDESPVISGGKRISNWIEEGPLWKAAVNEPSAIRDLYVDGKRAQRAKSAVMETAYSWYYRGGDPSSNVIEGIIVDRSDLAQYAAPQQIELHYTIGWKSVTLLVEELLPDSSGKTIVKMKQPYFGRAINMGYWSVKVTDPFVIENAFEELDEPGEFYYDAVNKWIYYWPKSGEAKETTEVVVPVLENIMELKGSALSQKVSDLQFEGLTFAYGTWLLPSEKGWFGSQAQSLSMDGSESIFTPANVRIEAAERITFHRNRFTHLGAVGVGLYEGVLDSNFIGNAFTDISDSAMSVGLPTHNYIDANLAQGKPASASSSYPGYEPSAANDGKSATGWAPNTLNPTWWQVDLGSPHKLSKIELVTRQTVDQPTTRNNFEIRASNDPNFSTYTVLGAQAGDQLPFKGSFIKSITDQNFYRYIRVVKTDTQYFFIAEFKVYGAASLTYNKQASASGSYSPSSGPSSANDGSYTTGWAMDSTYPAWWQVDLGKQQKISSLQLVTRQNVDQPAARHNFEVRASNDPQFASYTVLASQDADYIPYKGIWTMDATDQNAYRYLRVAKTDMGYFYIADFHAYGDQESGGVEETNKRINIQNNYISDIGAYFYGAPGIQAYYGEYIDISHNELVNMPYTGIAVGWGWYNYTDSTTTHHNTIAYNRISDVMRVAEDGAAIYTIGNQPNSSIIGNYIAGVHRGRGIYLDEGTRYYTVSHNVVEHVYDYWLYIWSSKILDSTAMDNWTSTAAIRNMGVNTPVSGTKWFNPNDPPVEVISIYEYSGLMSEYRDIALPPDLPSQFQLADHIASEAETGSLEGQYPHAAYNQFLAEISLAKACVEEENSNQGEILLAYNRLKQAIRQFLNEQNQSDILQFELSEQILPAIIDTDQATVTVLVYNGADLTRLSPVIHVSPGSTIMNEPGDGIYNFQEPYEMSVQRSVYGFQKEWTIHVQQQELVDETVISLNDAITDIDNWFVQGGEPVLSEGEPRSLTVHTPSGYSTYVGKVYGDTTLDFQLYTPAAGNDWPSVAFRTQRYDRSVISGVNDGYLVTFKANSIELQRFNGDQRTVFYGNVAGYTSLFGFMPNNSLFRFGEVNHVQVEARNEAQGVRIVIWLNGSKVFDLLDSYNGYIASPGYISVLSPTSPVTLIEAGE